MSQCSPCLLMLRTLRIAVHSELKSLVEMCGLRVLAGSSDGYDKSSDPWVSDPH